MALNMELIVGVVSALIGVVMTFIQIGIGAAGIGHCPLEEMIPKWLIGE